ncbi:thioesterase family protein [Oricola sp.]|uniref:acyl-CoA thioesterase n=1 Tax=Oricola sp. TaxID=1979950 RepID=UPI0025DA2315|nr:thioesterase family protein [Oricola sp.]MCI5078575.1 thioesterase family protein [Oricola sp.]
MGEGIECYRGVVHPWLCDSMGHMTTRHYTAMFDDASYHLLAALGFTPDHLAAGIGFADVKMTTTFVAELNAGALTVVFGRVVRVGNKSLTTHYRMCDRHTGETAAELEVVTTQFDLKSRRAVPLLPEIRAASEAMLAEAD